MSKFNSHKGHEIITETKFLFILIKYLVSFPYLLTIFFAGKIDKKGLFYIYYEFGHFFKDAYVTYNLILLNCFAFIIQVFVLAPLGILDFFVSSPENFSSFNLLSVISAPFLHGSVAHLFWNMLFLFVFGRVVEKYLGSVQMFIIYFCAAIISQIVSTGIFLQTGIGASGAVSGLVAAAILIRPFYLSYILIYPLPIFILGLIQITGDFFGFINPDPFSNISHIAHLAGYFSISITVFFLNKEKRRYMRKGLYLNLLFLAVFILLNLLFSK